MKFQRYNSIENKHRKKFIQQIILGGHSGGEWSVSEKVHGANASLWYDGNEFKFGKRSGFLSDNSHFYNFQKIVSDNKDRVIKLYRYYTDILGIDINSIVIYGELFGGIYPHPDVPKVPGATKVQKGIYYSPDNHFYAFDIKVDDQYLTVDKCNELFESFGFLYAKELFRGTLSEALDYPNDNVSTIYTEFDLPEIEEGMLGKDHDGNPILNIMEGVVIRPVIPAFLSSGARIIIKNKNTKWSESNHVKKNSYSSLLTQLSENQKVWYSTVLSHITENRLRNVVSKIGTITQRDFGKILRLFVLDIMEDATKDGLPVLDKKELHVLNKIINTQSATLIRKHFLNIIDNTW